MAQINQLPMPRGDYGMSNRHKTAEELRKQEFDKQKYFVGQFTNLYFAASKSPALQKHIISMGRDHIGGLAAPLRSLLQPMLKTSPFSDQQEKMRNYDERYPQAKITALWEEDKLQYAHQAFRADESQARRETFDTKITRVPATVLSMPEGNWAVKQPDGSTLLLTPEDMDLKQLSDKYGVSALEIIAGGFKVNAGKAHEIKLGGKAYSVQPQAQLLLSENDQRRLTTSIKPVQSFTEEPTKPIEIPDKLASFATAWAAKGKSGSTGMDAVVTSIMGFMDSNADAFTDKVNAEGYQGEAVIQLTDKLNQLIQGWAPGWQVRVLDPGTFTSGLWFWDNYTENELSMLKFFAPGEDPKEFYDTLKQQTQDKVLAGSAKDSAARLKKITDAGAKAWKPGE